MAKTKDVELCQQYLRNYLENIKKQLNQCQITLFEQSQSCPITELTLDQIDRCLKEFVDCQRKYLSIRNTKQLIDFKNDMYEKDLYEMITAYHLTNDQVS
jgi:hypothetical protein